MIFFFFVGWEMIMLFVEEFKYLKRDILISLFVAVVCVGLLYMLIVYVMVGIYVYGDEKGIVFFNLLMVNGMGWMGVYIIVCLVLFIIFSIVYVNIVGFLRMVYVMLWEGYILKYFDWLY